MLKARSIILPVLVALLLAFSVLPRGYALTQYLSDGFEDGDWTADPIWTTFGSQGCTRNIVASPARGSYSFEIIHDALGGAAWYNCGLQTSNFTAIAIPHSVSFWYRYVNITLDGQDLAEWGDSVGQMPWTIEIHTNGSIRLTDQIGPASSTWTGTALTNDTWYHIEAYTNTTATYLYLNNVYQLSMAMDTENIDTLGIYGQTNELTRIVQYWDDVIIADDYHGSDAIWVTFYRHTGIVQLQVNSITVANATTNGYINGTLITLDSTPDTGYDFWRYIITGASIHEINPYTHNVTESAIVQSYASSGGGGVTAQAMNWWLMLVGFVCFVSPPFVIAKRWHGQAANVIILLFVMVIGVALMTAGIS